ncbi:hypothetical protein EV127DRAFT_403219 [Xylaria flabelliformis]|nr:hypothetical protein EV127DRAFT_403219 [Xylaria flabelliformis]
MNMSSLSLITASASTHLRGSHSRIRQSTKQNVFAYAIAAVIILLSNISSSFDSILDSSAILVKTFPDRCIDVEEHCVVAAAFCEIYPGPTSTSRWEAANDYKTKDRHLCHICCGSVGSRHGGMFPPALNQTMKAPQVVLSTENIMFLCKGKRDEGARRRNRSKTHNKPDYGFARLLADPSWSWDLKEQMSSSLCGTDTHALEQAVNDLDKGC